MFWQGRFWQAFWKGEGSSFGRGHIGPDIDIGPVILAICAWVLFIKGYKYFFELQPPMRIHYSFPEALLKKGSYPPKKSGPIELDPNVGLLVLGANTHKAIL